MKVKLKTERKALYKREHKYSCSSDSRTAVKNLQLIAAVELFREMLES